MEVHRIELNTASLGSYQGGKVQAILNAELKRAVQDCLNRPTDKKTRKVYLEISMVPVPDDTGDLDHILIEFDATSKVPKRRTAPDKVGVTKAGQIFFMTEGEDDGDDEAAE